MRYPSSESFVILLAITMVCFRACAFCVSSRCRSPWSVTSQKYSASPCEDNSEAREVTLQNISLDILYEDEDLLAIHKPTGMVVQHSSGSVENAVAFYLDISSNQSFGSPSWPWKSRRSFEGIVHRLDKGTSGVMVVAKHPKSARALQSSFEERRVNKTYLAIAHGIPTKLQSATVSFDDNSKRRAESYIEPEPLPHQKRLSKDIKNCGDNSTKALELLDKAKDPSASCFSAAISVCRRAGEREQALSLLESITKKNKTITNRRNRSVKPNLLSFKTATSLCALDPPLWEKAVELVTQTMPESGLPLHPHCVSSAIAACGRAGRLDEVLALLKLIPDHPACLAAAAKACDRCGANEMARDIVLREEQCYTHSNKPDDHREDNSLRLGISTRVDSPIGKVGVRTMGVVMGNNGRDACSIVTPLMYKSEKSLNRVVIETGRTHQIRVHMANVLSCPLVGDKLYGNGKQQSGRLMLHATELLIPHPTTNITLQLKCPPPPDFESLALDIIGSKDHPVYKEIWKK